MSVALGKLLLEVHDNIGRAHLEKNKTKQKRPVVFTFALNIPVCLFLFYYCLCLKKLLFSDCAPVLECLLLIRK